MKRSYARLLLVALVIGALGWPGSLIATKLSDLTALSLSDIANPSQVFVLVTDAQSTAVSRKVPLDQLGLSTHLRLLTATSHGLSATDIGKPLYGKVVFDDTDADQYPTWVLAGIVDANTLLIAGDGAQVTIDVDLLQNGASYNVATSGYTVYWDKSSAMYYATKPVETESVIDPVLMITSVGATTFDAIVVAKPGLPDTDTVIVRATGLAALDTANFSAAVSKLNTNGGGAIGIEGKITLNANQSITAPISLFGVPGSKGEIELTDTTTIQWNSSFSPFSMSSVTIPATAAKTSMIKVPVGELEKGDWFIITADDTIEGVTYQPSNVSATLTCTADASTDKLTSTAHGLSNDTAVLIDTTDTMPGGLTSRQTYWVVNKSTNDFQVAETRGGAAINITSAGSGTITADNIIAVCPMEMHQVKEVRASDATYDYIIIDDFVVDAMTVNPRIYLMDSPTENITVENLKFSWTGTTSPTGSTLDFRKCVGVTVRNCQWEYDGPNEILIFYSSNVDISNIRTSNRKAYNTSEGYTVVAGVCNGVTFHDSVCKGQRHAFTTTANTNNGARYGTPRNVLVHDVVACQAARTDSSLICFDTHGEGWGVVFDGCTVIVPYDPRNPTAGSPTYNSNYGFQSRSRHTIFRNCRVEGTGNIYGWSILADDCVIESCSMENGWRGVYCREDGTGLTGSCNRLKVRYSSFMDLLGAAVIATHGDGHHISYCDFDNVGSSTYGGISAAVIHLDEGIDHRIYCNSMPRDSNTYSVGGTGWLSTRITGNTLTGYTGVSGATDSGFDSTHAAAVVLQGYADSYNFTD